MTILEVHNLKKVYTTRFGGNQVQALRNIQFSVEEGEYVAIMGESGSGKTTLLNILAALDRPTEGEVLLNGKNLVTVREKEIAAFRREHLGFVFQDFHLLDNFSLKDNIFLPLVLSNVPYKQMNEWLYPIAQKLGIVDILEKYPYEVSGGQKQRISNARDFLKNPPILILDEATSMLDPMGRREINSLVKELNKTKDITIISITHDIEEAKNADKVIMLNNGKVVISGRPEDIFSDEMKLVKYELDIPFALKVAQGLEKLNIKTSKSLDMEVLIEELCQLHLKK